MKSLTILYRTILKDLPKPKGSLLLKSYITRQPSFRLLLNYRIGNYLYNSKGWCKSFSSLYRVKMIQKRSCDISFQSNIGSHLKLPHPISIIIGADVVIGNNVTIYQNVTLGSHGKNSGKKEYPTIKDNVTIYAGCVIFGSVTIGENSIIGANTVVNKNIPPNSVAYGNPLQIKQIKLHE